MRRRAENQANGCIGGGLGPERSGDAAMTCQNVADAILAEIFEENGRCRMQTSAGAP